MGVNVYLQYITMFIFHPTIEILFIDTVMENHKMVMVSICRPPSTNSIPLIDKLSELKYYVRNGYDEIILCGDMNLDILNYNNNKNTSNLLNSLMSQSLILMITIQSRITDQIAALIDSILATQPNRFISGLLSLIHLSIFHYLF